MFFAKNSSQNHSFFSSKLIWVNQINPGSVESESDFLYAGLSNVMSELENDSSEGPREQCAHELEALKKPIQSKDDFGIRANNWIYLRESIEALKRKDITAHELRSLMISTDIGSFADRTLDEGRGNLEAEEIISKVRQTAVETSESNTINLLNAAREGEITRTKAALIEAKGITENGLREYLGIKMKTVSGVLEEVKQKKPQRLELKTFERLNEQLIQYHELIGSQKQFQEFDKQGLTGVLDEIETLDGDLKSLDQEPDSIETLNGKIDQLVGFFEGITDEQVGKLIKSRKGLEGEFADIGKERSVKRLNFLKNVRKKLKKLKKNLNHGKLDIDQQQLLQRDLDVKLAQFGGLSLTEQIDSNLDPEKKTDAQRARQVIEQLKGVTDIKKIKEVLLAQLKPEQVDFVSDKKFKNYKDLNGDRHNLKDYTSGEMVFYEHGDHWKIVIKKELLSNENAGEKLQKQITHELLHVEFENNSALKKYWVEKYTSNPKWNEIKSKFVEKFPNKRPPNFIGPARLGGYTPGEWPDEAVVSELYAMEADDSEMGEVGEMIAKAGVSGVTPKFLGFDEESGKEMTAMPTAEAGDESGAEGSSEVRGSYDEFTKGIDNIKKQIKTYKNSEFIGYIPGAGALLNSMAGFNKKTEERNERFRDNKSGFLAEIIKERIEKPKEDLDIIKEEIKRVSEEVGHDGNPIRNIWNKTRFMSLQDIFNVGVNMKEFFSRRNKRRVADHSARLGMALFDKIPFLNDFATDSSAQKEKAEAEEVSEWEGRLSNKDVPTLYDMLNDISKQIDPSKDQFKAILRVLADKGALEWRNQAIWIILSKLQNAASLSVNDELIKNDSNLLRSRIKSAMGEIWDKDEFLNLDNKHESGYKSRKDAHNPKIEKSAGTIGEQLNALYLKFTSGRRGEVEPAEYEALIEYAIVNGKFNAEQSLFYLVAGMGMGILSPDRGQALNTHSMLFPPMDWLTMSSGCNSKEDWANLCKAKFKKEYENGALDGMNSSFHSYYYTTIMNSFGFKQRLGKATKADKKFDPDWCKAIVGGASAEITRTHMAGTSGRREASIESAGNTIAGRLQWLEENAKNPQENFKEDFSKSLAGFAMSEAIYAGVAFESDKNFWRVKSGFEDPPIEHKSTNHPGESVNSLNNKIKDFALHFDGDFKELMTLITSTSKMKENKGEALLAEIVNFISKYPELADVMSATNLDAIFSSLDRIVQAVLSRIPESVFVERAQLILR